jgi:hypothetical protein
MKLHIVVKHLGDKPWIASSAFLERRLAENLIECEQANDTHPRWQFGIVSGEIEVQEARESQ